MSGEPIKVILLVENCADDAGSLHATFQHRSAPETEVIHARSMADAETLLAQRAVGTILLDLQLPDARGLGSAFIPTMASTPKRWSRMRTPRCIRRRKMAVIVVNFSRRR